MASNDALQAMATKLWKDPSVKGWEAFRKVLLASNAKYYRTRYPNGKLKQLEDLPNSYCELFDANYKVVANIPVYKKVPGSKIEGALWYIRGMLNSNMPVTAAEAKTKWFE